MTQSFGPEARGGSSSAQVILSTEPILYPYVTQPDILVVMSQEAYARFAPAVEAGRHPDHRAGTGATSITCPTGMRALRRAGHAPGRGTGPQDGAEHRDGGFFRRRHRPAGPRSAAPGRGRFGAPGFQKLNLQAFDKGYEYGASLIEKLREEGETEMVLSFESES